MAVRVVTVATAVATAERVAPAARPEPVEPLGRPVSPVNPANRASLGKRRDLAIDCARSIALNRAPRQPRRVHA